MTNLENWFHFWITTVVVGGIAHSLTVEAPYSSGLVAMGWVTVFGFIFLIMWFMRISYLVGVGLKRRYTQEQSPPF